MSQLSAPQGVLAPSNGAIDVLINNAGISAPSGQADKGTLIITEDTTARDMIKVPETNVAAVVQVTSESLRIIHRLQQLTSKHSFRRLYFPFIQVRFTPNHQCLFCSWIITI